MPVSFVFMYVGPVTQRYRQRKAWKASLLVTIRKYGRFIHYNVHPYDQWVIVKRWLRFVFSVVQNFTEHFKQKHSMIDTSAVTVFTKSSMNPWSSPTTNHHLRGSGERNREKRRTNKNKGKFWYNQDANVGAAVIGENKRLGTKQCWAVKNSKP